MNEQCKEETHHLGRLKPRPEAALRLYWIAMRVTSHFPLCCCDSCKSRSAEWWAWSRMHVPSHSVRRTAIDPFRSGWSDITLRVQFGSRATGWHNGLGSSWELARWRGPTCPVQLDVHRSEFETSLYATWSALTSQPTIPAACRRSEQTCVQTPLLAN
jgi:hypothetical protein